jgi:hypothetical protein
MKVPEKFLPILVLIGNGRKSNKTDRSILQEWNENRRTDGKPVVSKEQFDLFIKLFNRDVENFPAENKPINADKWLKLRRDGMGTWSPENQGAELKRREREKNSESWEPNPRNPLGTTGRYQNRLDYSERVQEDCILIYGGKIIGFYEGIPAAIQKADSCHYESFTVVNTEFRELFSRHPANMFEREHRNNDGSTEPFVTLRK